MPIKIMNFVTNFSVFLRHTMEKKIIRRNYLGGTERKCKKLQSVNKNPQNVGN